MRDPIRIVVQTPELPEDVVVAQTFPDLEQAATWAQIVHALFPRAAMHLQTRDGFCPDDAGLVAAWRALVGDDGGVPVSLAQEMQA